MVPTNARGLEPSAGFLGYLGVEETMSSCEIYTASPRHCCHKEMEAVRVFRVAKSNNNLMYLLFFSFVSGHFMTKKVLSFIFPFFLW